MTKATLFLAWEMQETEHMAPYDIGLQCSGTIVLILDHVCKQHAPSVQEPVTCNSLTSVMQQYVQRLQVVTAKTFLYSSHVDQHQLAVRRQRIITRFIYLPANQIRY